MSSSPLHLRSGTAKLHRDAVYSSGRAHELWWHQAEAESSLTLIE